MNYHAFAVVAASACAGLASSAQASITFVQTFEIVSDDSSLTIGSPLRGEDPVPTFSIAGTVDLEINFNGTIVESAKVVDFSIGFADNPLVLDLGVFGTATLENVNASMEEAGATDYFSKGDQDNGEFDDGFITQNGNLAATSGTATITPGTDLGPGTSLDLSTLDPEFRGFDIEANLRKPFNTDDYTLEARFNTPVLTFSIDGLPIALQIDGFLSTKPAPLIPAAPTAVAMLAGVLAVSRRR